MRFRNISKSEKNKILKKLVQMTYKKISILALLASLLCGCDQNQHMTDNVSEPIEETAPIKESKTEFERYSKNIRIIDLPLHLKCDQELRDGSPKIDTSLISKYGISGSSIYRKFAETEYYTAIVYLQPADIVLPVIQTTDKQGNKISALPLYERWCGEDEHSQGISWAGIEKDMTIVLSDSVIHFKRDKNGEIIPKSKKTKVRQRIYHIEPNGMIKEQKR
jgi:hypothetical protein